MAQPARILVVEDHPINVKVAQALLETEGYEVIVARDGATALQTARSLTPDLILLDLKLPDIAGLDIARQLKADPVTRTIPLVALTAYAMRGDEERARAAGCDGYVTKPINREAFMHEVARHCAHRHA